MKLLGLTAMLGLAFVACADEETDGSGGAPSAGGMGGASVGGGGGDSPMPPTNGGGGNGGQGGGGGAGGQIAFTCGNGETDPGEDCDDGNVSDGDGCSAVCAFEPTGPDDICPGVEIALGPVVDDQQIGSVGGTTTTVLPQYGGSCGGSANDTVYLVTPTVAGQLTATLTSDFDAILHARSTCDDPLSEVGCEDAGLDSEPETVSFEVSPGVPVYLFVDGYGGEAGSFTLDVEVATAFCGNGIAELPERCDDGNLTAADGCSPGCDIEAGGDPDDCPGQIFNLSSADPLAVRHIGLLGDTSALDTGITPTSCSGSGKQEIFGIVPDVDGHMRVDLIAAYDDATVYVRGECDTTGTQLDCSEAAEPSEQLSITVPVFANNVYFVFADSASSTKFGPYALDVYLTPGACGNDEVDGGEECDDGNADIGDGCDPLCVLEVPPLSNDTCPGAPLAIDPLTNAAVVTASTETLTPNWAGTCLTATTTNDAVYELTSPIDGHVTLALDPYFDGGLYVRSECTTTGATAQLGCIDAIDGNGGEALGVPVEAGVPLYVFVDSATSTQNGVFELSASVSPAQCGNGVLDGGEGCDDANALAGDGCAASCVLEPAGPEENCPGEPLALTQVGPDWEGSVYSGTFNLASNLTATGCTSSGRDAVFSIVAPMDGVLQASLPQAAFNATLYARTDCATTASQVVCANDNASNGLETIAFPVVMGATYFIVVDTTTSSIAPGPFLLDVKVVPPGCGDGFVTGAEECDDANATAGDGCAPDCGLETLVGNDQCPGYPVVLTGTGTDPRIGVITTDTTLLASNYVGTCGGSSRDAVYAVSSDIDGNLVAKLTPAPGLDAVLHARSDCGNVGTQLACDDLATSGYTVSIPVTANTPLYLFVDGLNGELGVSTLSITVTP